MIRVRLREAIQAYTKRTGEPLSYRQLAEKTGIARATIESLASRPHYNATLATIDKLCSTLQCDLDELLEHSPD